MKNYTYSSILLIIYLISYSSIKACDVCGAGCASNFMGLIPNSSKTIIGVRQQIQQFNFSGESSTPSGNGIYEKATFYRSDLWIRKHLHQKVQFFVFIPYQSHQIQESNYTTSVQSIGDISLSSFYTLYNTTDSMRSMHKHRWLLGGNIQLPTGKYQQRDQDLSQVPILFQVGKGAYALGIQNIYTYKYKNNGINTDLNYVYFTQNELGDQLGKQFMGILQAFKLFDFYTHALIPNLGMVVENSTQNKQFKNTIPTTGGNTFNALIGCDIYFKKWIIQSNYTHPIALNLANDMPQSTGRISVSLNYLL